jgi:hypothetical protein
MLPDPRDAVLVEAIVAATVGLVRAVHQGDRLRVIGELNQLLAAIIEHNATLGEHPHNEALRRAIQQLGG